MIDIESLEKISEERFRNQEKAVDIALRNQEKALEVALISMNKRLDNMNEFREALNDQNRTLISRTEVIAIIKPIEDKIDISGKPNLTIIGSLGSLLIGAIAAMWLVIGLKIDNSNTPLALSIEQLKTSHTAFDSQVISMNNQIQILIQQNSESSTNESQAKTERINIIERLKANESSLATGRAERLSAQADGQIRYVYIVNWLSILHKKLFPHEQVPSMPTVRD